MFFILQFKLLFDLKAGLVIYLSGLAHFNSTKSGTKGMPKNLDRPVEECFGTEELSWYVAF